MDIYTLVGTVGIVVFTGATCFVLGAYCQHSDVLKNIKILERRNIYAYRLREPLYGLLKYFPLWNETRQERHRRRRDQSSKGNAQIIMKYGFPSTEDIRIFDDFVVSYDIGGNDVMRWMCEYVRASAQKNKWCDIDLDCPCDEPAPPTNKSADHESARHLYLTSILPYLSDGFNTNTWRFLETYIERLVECYGSVYVYTGPMYLPEQRTSGKWFIEYKIIGSKLAAIPTHFFKVIVIESDDINKPYVEAYLIPNAATDESDTDIRSLLTDIRIIEDATGLKFLALQNRNFLSSSTASDDCDCDDY